MEMANALFEESLDITTAVTWALITVDSPSTHVPNIPDTDVGVDMHCVPWQMMAVGTRNLKQPDGSCRKLYVNRRRHFNLQRVPEAILQCIDGLGGSLLAVYARSPSLCLFPILSLSLFVLLCSLCLSLICVSRMCVTSNSVAGH